MVKIPDRLITWSIHHLVLFARFCGIRTLEAERGDSVNMMRASSTLIALGPP